MPTTPRSDPPVPRPADPLSYAAAGTMLLVVVIAVAYTIYLQLAPTSPAGRSLDLIERDLAAARAQCVAGPPQGAACRDAARLTTEIAERRRGGS